MRLPAKGQMSLVMMLAIASALVLYAASQNWSRIAAYKTQTTIAATTAASQMASTLASSGEYYLVTQMGQKMRIVENTSAGNGFWNMICAIVVAIVAIVITIASWGTGTCVLLAAVVIIGSLLSAGLAISSYTQDVNKIQPGLTKAWQKSIADLPKTEYQVAEQALQSMMFSLVNDQVMVPDRWDMDMDGHWHNPNHPAGYQGDPSSKKIARLSYYYGSRLNGTINAEESAFGALLGLLTDMQLYLGLTPLGGNSACYTQAGVLKPQCDPCCQNPATRNSFANFNTCDNHLAYVEQCATGNPSCSPSSLWGCYVYDPLYAHLGAAPQDPPKNFVFTFGEDDTDPHRKYVAGNLVEEDPAGPFPLVPTPLAENGAPKDGGVFRGSDTWGSFFPFMWLLADTNPGVKGLGLSNSTLVGPNDPGCFWRAKDTTGAPSCQVEVAATPPPPRPPYPPQGATIGKAFYRGVLPLPPGSSVYDQLTLPYPCLGKDCYVNLFRNTTDPASDNVDSRQIDNVAGIPTFLPLTEDACETEFFGMRWKKGNDRLSQTFYRLIADPNSPLGWTAEVDSLMYLAKNATVGHELGCLGDTCVCGNENLVTERWRGDNFDRVVSQLWGFSYLTNSFLSLPENQRAVMANMVNTWGVELKGYANVLMMVGEVLPPSPAYHNPHSEYASLTADMTRWLGGEPVGGPSYTGADLWCLPSDPMAVGEAERTAIQTKAGGGQVPWGSLESVVNCLAYNSNNYTAFQNCYNGCSGGGIEEEEEEETNVDALGGGGAGGQSESGGGQSQILGGLSESGGGQSESSGGQGGVTGGQSEGSGGQVDGGGGQDGNPSACVDLPRSLVPGFNPNVGVDCTPNSAYLQNIAKSRTLARNQSVKFQKRALYLNDLKTRAEEIVNTFSFAHNYLTQTITPATYNIGFLPPNSQVTRPALLRDIVDWMEEQAEVTESSLGNELVYGWFSKKPEGSTRPHGYLHIIKVQASSPLMRGALSGSLAGPNNEGDVVPYIDTGELDGGKKRWYELVSDTGDVGARAIRYDEEHDWGLRFLSGLPLWNIRARNPAGPQGAGPVADIAGACLQHYTRVLRNGVIEYDLDAFFNTDPDLKEAFMFDLPLPASAPPALQECAGLVQQLLKRGIVSQTCARYYPKCTDTNLSEGCSYEIKFRPCL